MRKFGLWMAGVGFRYQAAVKHAKKELGDDDMSLLNFDWHHNIKELGAHMAVQASIGAHGLSGSVHVRFVDFAIVQGLWSRLKPVITAMGIDIGEATVGAAPTGVPEPTERQRGVPRCAAAALAASLHSVH